MIAAGAFPREVEQPGNAAAGFDRDGPVCWIAAIFLAWLISSPRALAGFDFDVEGRSKLARYVGSFLAVGSFLPTSTVPTDSNNRSVDNGTQETRMENGNPNETIDRGRS